MTEKISPPAISTGRVVGLCITAFCLGMLIDYFLMQKQKLPSPPVTVPREWEEKEATVVADLEVPVFRESEAHVYPETPKVYEEEQENDLG